MIDLVMESQPDDFAGNDVSTGVAYLFRSHNLILHIGGAGATLKEYVSRKELESAWQQLTDDLEPSGEPHEGDYVIEMKDDVYRCRDGEWSGIDNALNYVKQCVDEDEHHTGKRPTVWFRTRHNNFKVIDLE